MGYCAHFQLSVEIPKLPSEREIIEAFRDQNEAANYCLTDDGNSNEGGKWYDHQADLEVFSKQYPGVLFTLTGEGEESGDIWALYVKDGRSQRAKAQISIEPFDESKLA